MKQNCRRVAQPDGEAFPVAFVEIYESTEQLSLQLAWLLCRCGHDFARAGAHERAIEHSAAPEEIPIGDARRSVVVVDLEEALRPGEMLWLYATLDKEVRTVADVVQVETGVE